MLDKKLLENEIRKITDVKYCDFEGFPEDSIQVAERWSCAIDKYAKGIFPPSTSLKEAKLAMMTSFLGLSIDAKVAFSLGFSTYSVLLGIGMLPIFNAIAPPKPIDLSSSFLAGMKGSSGHEVAILMSNIVHLWFKTGISVNVSTGVSLTWI